jgi:multiple sugar transport system permease protein
MGRQKRYLGRYLEAVFGRRWKTLLPAFAVHNDLSLPIVMLILPLFILMRQLRLLDTYFALISAHATFTLPFAI